MKLAWLGMFDEGNLMCLCAAGEKHGDGAVRRLDFFDQTEIEGLGEKTAYLCDIGAIKQAMVEAERAHTAWIISPNVRIFDDRPIVRARYLGIKVNPVTAR